MLGTRRTASLAVAVTVLMLVSSLGLLAALNAPASHAGPAAPAKSTATQVTPASPVQPLSVGSSPSLASPPAATGPAPTSRMGEVLAAIEAKGISPKDVFLPDLNANPHPSLTNGHITPLYGNGPAPYGVAEFGLQNDSGTITPYTLSTPSLEGTYMPSTMNGLSADISGPDEYGVQLNAVLNNVQIQGVSGYQFWTQNVIEYSPYSSSLFFVSNIWNFSGGPLASNTFYQIGPNATLVAPEYYYGLGGPITISYPFTLDLFLNSTQIGGRDAVFFNFTVSNTTEFYTGSYDFAIFNSTTATVLSAPFPEYVANGSSYNPIGLPDDFEMTLGGPGGGSNFDVFDSNAYVGLQYWNATATVPGYQTVPSAYGFGSDTGETSYGVGPIWGYEPGLVGISEPNEFLTLGPSNAVGLWNVSGSAPLQYNYGGYVFVNFAPSNGFLFLAPSNTVFTGWDTTNWSEFQWLPDLTYGGAYELSVGTYTIVGIQANYDPAEETFTIASGGMTPSFSEITLALTSDNLEGVYTPLWALNNSGIANISTAVAGTNVLYSDQFFPIGRPAESDAVFPWFGITNDYLFPIFEGILLWDTSLPVVVGHPNSFQTYYPSWMSNFLAFYGLPRSNDLQFLFWNVTDVTLIGGDAIGGWWWSNAYFGPDVSTYNVVFWNATDSQVIGNTFATGGNALWFYGGTDNLVYNNTFTESIPISPDPYATVAAAYGSVGIFEADYGEAYVASEQFGGNNSTACYFDTYCDVVFNNVFDVEAPAIQPFYDPYYFYLSLPTCPAYLGGGTCYFSTSWNLPWTGTDGPNIIGGPLIGGNYWWNYGTSDDPYTDLPYTSYTSEFGPGIEIGGDYNPLTLVPVYTVTVAETGLPAATVWGVEVYQYGGLEEYAGSNSTNTTSTTVLLAAGEYYFAAYSYTAGFAAVEVIATVSANGQVNVTFAHVYTVTVTETGLPSGVAWYVYLVNATGIETNSGVSEGPTLNVTEVANGTYTWYAYSESEWWTASPSSGPLTVSGNSSAAVTFVAVVGLTFDVTGLASGTGWVLVLEGGAAGNFSTVTDASSYTVNVAAGSVYTWTVSALGYVATPSTGSLTVVGNTTTAIAFAAVSAVVFSETGLTAGTLWTISFTQGGQTVRLSSVAATLVIPTSVVGAFNWSVSAAGYTAAPPTGTGTAPTGSVSVAFTAVPAPSTSSSSNGISSTAWLLIAVLAALAVVFLVTTILFMGKARKPPAITAYSGGTPPASGGAPPAAGGGTGGTPPWSEGGAPPPGAT